MTGVPALAEAILAQMVLLWSQGDAARHDPVLSSLLARHTACLNRLAPGLADRARAAFETLVCPETSTAEVAR